MKSFRRTLFDRLVLARRPSVPTVQMASALLSSLGMVGITVRLASHSPLYRANGGELVDLVVDDVLAPHVLASHQWQSEEVDFLRMHGMRQPCVLVDVGANIGLVTRQLLHQTPQIAAAVCFEPHPQNFHYLRRNLKHLEQCYLQQTALGPFEGELVFFEDTHNIGNYSLNADAMQGKEHRTSVVRCTKATMENLVAPLPESVRHLPILWKSDTQGFDETIVTMLPDEFWSKVRAGVMEIWRIDRPAFDAHRLASILREFDVLHFGDSPALKVSAEDVVRYAEGRDGGSRDLHFARG